MATTPCAPMSMGAVNGYVAALPGKGAPLPAPTRQFFEARMGHDFSRVRVHTGEEAAQSARALQAKAYTTGQQIVFGKGQYDTTSGEGKRLLAHELVHVVQQDDRVQRKKEADTYMKKEKIEPTHTIRSDEKAMKTVVTGILSNKDSSLHSYMSSKLGGLKDTKISIDDNGPFGYAYRKYANKRGEHQPDNVKDEDLALDVRGFYDQDTNTAHVRTRVNYCQLLHETVHSLSNPHFLFENVGDMLMEGLTQYFTDIVMKEQMQLAGGAASPCKDSSSYGPHVACAEQFVSKFGLDTMAKLFFASDTSVLDTMATRFGYKDAHALALARSALCARVKDIH